MHAGDDVDFAAPPVGQIDAPEIDRLWNLALTRKGTRHGHRLRNEQLRNHQFVGWRHPRRRLHLGYGGDDSIFGLGGDDYIVGGAGADALHGGPGSDTAGYYNSTAGIIASLTAGVGVGGDAEGDTYFSIENLVGSQLRGRARRQRRQQLAYRS